MTRGDSFEFDVIISKSLYAIRTVLHRTYIDSEHACYRKQTGRQTDKMLTVMDKRYMTTCSVISRLVIVCIKQYKSNNAVAIIVLPL